MFRTGRTRVVRRVTGGSGGGSSSGGGGGGGNDKLEKLTQALDLVNAQEKEHSVQLAKLAKRHEALKSEAKLQATVHKNRSAAGDALRAARTLELQMKPSRIVVEQLRAQKHKLTIVRNALVVQRTMDVATNALRDVGFGDDSSLDRHQRATERFQETSTNASLFVSAQNDAMSMVIGEQCDATGAESVFDDEAGISDELDRLMADGDPAMPDIPLTDLPTTSSVSVNDTDSGGGDDDDDDDDTTTEQPLTI